MLNRRHLLLSPLLGLGLAQARSRVTLDRISLLTDEAGKSPREALDFAKQYGLKWIEVRGVPGGGGSYWSLPEDRLRAAKQEFDEAGVKVSFLNTSMLKYVLPGAEPARRPNVTEEAWKQRMERDAARFAARMDELASSIRAARILGVDKIRVFAFTRVPDPAPLFPRLAEVLEPMAARAREEGMQLLIENEASCNIARTAELASFFGMMKHKGLGINWDPVNAMHREEPEQFPQAFSLMPKDRIHNVQMKAEALVLGPVRLDWTAIFRQLDRDGYQGRIGLETHVFDGTLIEKAHLSMKRIQEILGELA
jgi:sugar phosphate isomerase/epimerase